MRNTFLHQKSNFLHQKSNFRRFTDVTPADEDTKSIHTYNAMRHIQMNLHTGSLQEDLKPHLKHLFGPPPPIFFIVFYHFLYWFLILQSFLLSSAMTLTFICKLYNLLSSFSQFETDSTLVTTIPYWQLWIKILWMKTLMKVGSISMFY